MPVIDGHNDYPWEVRQKAELDLAKLDMRQPQPTIMTDFARLAAGGVGGQFWSVYVPSPAPGTDPAASVTPALEQIDIVHRMVARYPDKLALALTADDIERAQKQGKIASLIGMEGGHCDQLVAGHAADDASPRRALHDADAQPERALGRLGDRHAEARRAVAVRRRGRPRDEPAGHAGRSEPHVAGDDGRRASASRRRR